MIFVKTLRLDVFLLMNLGVLLLQHVLRVHVVILLMEMLSVWEGSVMNVESVQEIVVEMIVVLYLVEVLIVVIGLKIVGSLEIMNVMTVQVLVPD